jgi:hypothetical protein
LRSLRDPWRRLDQPTDLALAASAGAADRPTAAPPPEALLAGDSQHWLITDGTRPALLAWPGQRQPDRLIQVGSSQRNVGLERLSARRDTDDPGQIALLLQVANGGTAVEMRTVVFSTDAGEAARSTQTLKPGQTMQVAARVPASAQARAQLQPADTLTEDDTITLDLGPLRRQRVAVDARCPAALVAAVATHPALSPATPDATEVDAAVDCGTAPDKRRAPTIRLRADRASQTGTGALQWSARVPDTQRPRLDAGKLALAAHLDEGHGQTVLLAIGDEPVIVDRAGSPRVLDTALDFDAMAATRGPEVPLMVNWLFEHLLGRRLLDATALADRGSGAARVVPAKAAETAPAARAPAPARTVHELTPPLLLAALAVLLWEMIALGRQWRHLARPVEADAE